MYLIVSIIRPHKLDDVRAALIEAGIEGMTASEVKGFGRQRGHTELYRGAEYVVDFLPKVKLEVVVVAERLDAALDAIQSAAQTGRVGDGKIFVLPMQRAMRIRTAELDADAL